MPAKIGAEWARSQGKSRGYSVVREYCGHGIGRVYHEDPQVLHYGEPGTGLELKAGISDPVNTVLAWWMADAAGFYKAHGLDVRVVDMQGGSRGAQALQDGNLEVMHVGLSSVIRINRAGSRSRGYAMPFESIRAEIRLGVRSSANAKAVNQS